MTSNNPGYQSPVKFIRLTTGDDAYIQQCAELLYSEFKEHWPNAWPTMDSAEKEIRECAEEDKIFRIALASGEVIGCVGCQPHYGGNVWEVHPLVVRKDFQKQGVGKLLLQDIEIQAKRENGLTLILGSDDENGMTSVAGIDLYPDPIKRLLEIKNIKNHPYEFYIKCGFSLVGIVPDANGIGKPDILLAKNIEKTKP